MDKYSGDDTDDAEFEKEHDEMVRELIRYLAGESDKAPVLGICLIPRHVAALKNEKGDIALVEFCAKLKAKDEEAWASLFGSIMDDQWMGKYLQELRPYSPWPNAVCAIAQLNTKGDIYEVVVEDLSQFLNAHGVKGSEDPHPSREPALLIIQNLNPDQFKLIVQKPNS